MCVSMFYVLTNTHVKRDSLSERILNSTKPLINRSTLKTDQFAGLFGVFRFHCIWFTFHKREAFMTQTSSNIIQFNNNFLKTFNADVKHSHMLRAIG